MNEKMIKEIKEESYNKGLYDAWGFANKVNNMTDNKLGEIYNIDSFDAWGEVFKMPPQEALAKLKAYEEGQSKIEVGDVFIDTDIGVHCVLSKIVEEGEGRTYIVTYADGSGGSRSKKTFLEDYKKTGKHIDITSILEQIREV